MACSKSDWKRHKPVCKERQARFDNWPEPLRVLQIKLENWVQKNDTWLFLAGLDTLLPHKDYLADEGHLLKTHILIVDVEECHRPPIKFIVQRAQLELVKKSEEGCKISGKEGAVDRMEPHGRDDERDEREPTVGVMKIVVRCYPATQIQEYKILQVSLDLRRPRERLVEWEESLKVQTLMNGGTYRTPDGHLLAWRNNFRLEDYHPAA